MCIRDRLNKTEADKTPLQKQLDRLTIIIASLAGLAFVLMVIMGLRNGCLLYTSDAADERSSVDLGGRRIIKKKKKHKQGRGPALQNNMQHANM